jgi:NHL repeat
VGGEKLNASPEMWLQRQKAQGLEREKQFWGPTAVEVDDENRIFVAESVRSRIQVYRKQIPYFIGDRLYGRRHAADMSPRDCRLRP